MPDLKLTRLHHSFSYYGLRVWPAPLTGFAAPCRGKFRPGVTTRTRPQPTYLQRQLVWRAPFIPQVNGSLPHTRRRSHCLLSGIIRPEVVPGDLVGGDQSIVAFFRDANLLPRDAKLKQGDQIGFDKLGGDCSAEKLRELLRAAGRPVSFAL